MAEEKKCNNTSCSGDCANCASAKKENQSLLEPTNELNSIKKVIGVVSGKGGVGKSMVSASLATLMKRKGYEVGLMDADITGPSIPKMFGVNARAASAEGGIMPEITHSGIKMMSINLLMENPESPVVWRGPVIAGAVKQFWSDVIWGETDYLFIDCPPGTGDVPLTVFQSIPLDGIVIVTSPQDLVSLIVKKAYNMAKLMNIPVLGIVENMSYVKCPDCGKEFHIFGKSETQSVADELGIPLLDKMPIDTTLATLADEGHIERLDTHYLDNTANVIEKL